ncbi:MAG TPA: SBBP repeat-containing protein, partial [Pyrinomonadaceae bacterium]
MNRFRNYVSSKTALAPLALGAAGFMLLALMMSVGRASFNTPLHVPDVPNAAGPDALAEVNVRADYGKLPLRFEVNQGQTDGQVKFLARGSGYSLYLTAAETVLRLRRDNPDEAQSAATVRMKVTGAKPNPRVNGVDELPGRSNYFIGNDPRKWRTGVPSYAKVEYEQVYPGVDVVYYGTRQGELEYDFRLGAGADPKAIRMAFEGVDELEADGEGGLRLHVAGRQLQLRRPVLYQEKDGARQEVAGGYVLAGPREVGFTVAAYDAARPLVIDPVLAYSTFLGGTGYDVGLSIAVNPHGNAFITGKTASLDFPTQPNLSKIGPGGGFDAFVTEMNMSGSALVYSTYLGGSADENDWGGLGNFGGIAIDPAGNAYVTGLTTSDDFPTTPGVLQPTAGNNGFIADAYVTKLDAAGSLVYSTYFGGKGFDGAHAIAVDPFGQAYITGQEESGGLPANGFQKMHSAGCAAGYKDGFVAKLNADGSKLLYSTYFGGNSCNIGFGIAVDAAENAYVTGETQSTNFPFTPGAFDQTCGTDGACNPVNNQPISDIFVTKIATKLVGLASLQYATYLGGSGEERFIYNGGPGGIAIDPAAKFIYVTGTTASVNPADFPVTNGSLPNGPGDAFVAKLDPAQPAPANQLVYSTYLGGSSTDIGTGIAVDINGNAYVTGAGSGDFPVTPGMSACADQGAFVVKMGAAGSVKYAACLSGNKKDIPFSIAVDPSGCAYVTGS